VTHPWQWSVHLAEDEQANFITKIIFALHEMININPLKLESENGLPNCYWEAHILKLLSSFICFVKF
jgi:hypothetical protein